MVRFEYKRPIDENATMVQLFVRVLGLLWLFVMLDTAWQWTSLCGEDGLLPAHALAGRARELYAPWQFFRFPSLLWISQSNGYALALIAVGAVGAIMALTDRLATLGLIFSFSVWLSIVNFGGDFFVHMWDTLLLEVGFLAIFISWLRNAGVGRKMAMWAIWILNFRFWFSMGMVKLLHAGDGGIGLGFLDGYFPNQPMPTPAAWHFAYFPEWLRSSMGALVLFAELILPFTLVWKRTRFLGLIGFAMLSIMMQMTGNFGFLNILCLIMALPLLIGTKWGSRVGKWLSKSERWNRYLRIDPQYQRLRGWPRKGGMAALQFQILLQFVLVVLLFFPVGNKDLNFLNYVAYNAEVVEWEGNANLKTTLLSPMRAGSNFRITNPYGVFKRMPSNRREIVFEATADTSSGFWHPYAYHFKPGAGNPPSWFAPVFPRFEQQLYHEAQQMNFYRLNTFHHLWGRTFCWTDKLIQSMWEGNQVDRWFNGDPLHGEKPQAIRMQVLEMRFASPEEREKSGSYWKYDLVYSQMLPGMGIATGCPLVAAEPQ